MWKRTNSCKIVDLIDGRTLIVPLSWYPRLMYANGEERQNWQLFLQFSITRSGVVRVVQGATSAPEPLQANVFRTIDPPQKFRLIDKIISRVKST
ncbi:MAG: DUF2442 domain-containing protein [Microcoleus sp. SU_5_6]|nr:DUF2442 domain-containing protein [Microcoleus sp. SU_5_6]